jgi:hypothetical protein
MQEAKTQPERWYNQLLAEWLSDPRRSVLRLRSTREAPQTRSDLFGFSDWLELPNSLQQTGGLSKSEKSITLSKHHSVKADSAKLCVFLSSSSQTLYRVLNRHLAKKNWKEKKATSLPPPPRRLEPWQPKPYPPELVSARQTKFISFSFFFDPFKVLLTKYR